jgi:hypothetical protein
MSVTTRRRVWLGRAGIVTAVAAAGLFGLAFPVHAAADDPAVAILPLADFNPGQTQTLQIRVTNNISASGQSTFQIQVTNVPSDFTVSGPQGCSGSGGTCSVAIDNGGGSKDISFQISAKQQVSVGPGQTQQYNAKVNADTLAAGGKHGEAGVPLTLHGPDQSAVVPSVSGRVVNLFDVKPIANATVLIQDSAGTQWQIGTDKNGQFTVASTPQKPIMPGAMGILVKKTGWADLSKSDVGRAGTPLVLDLRMSPASPTAEASTALPSAGASTDGIDTGGASTDTGAGADSGGGGISWTLILIGGFLVLVGIAAIVLLFLRNRSDGGAGPDRPGPPRRPRGGPGRPQVRGGGPRPPGRGPGVPKSPAPAGMARGDRTGTMRRPDPSGMPRGVDHTVISRSPLADPTQLHGRMPDHTDPYGRATQPPPPPPPPPGYGQGYGGQGYGGSGYTGSTGYGGGPSTGYAGSGPAYPEPYARPGPYQTGQGQSAYDTGHGRDTYDTGSYERRAHPTQGDRRLDWMDD